jgi:cytochrome c-type biogenesis protein CcmF
MNIGHVLLWVAVAATLGVLVVTLAARARQGRGGARPAAMLGRSASIAALVLVAAATVHLGASLAGGDFSIAYVWRHSATYEPTLQRVGALLAGQEGSFLVWSLAAAIMSAWTAGRWARADASDRAGAWIVHVVASGITLALVSVTVAVAPFRSFTEAFPSLHAASAPAEGRGLNPVLANSWMHPHTALTFVSYALIGLGFAIAVAELVRAAQGRQADARCWRAVAVRVNRFAWLALSASLLMGLLWAYEEMSFGWFWSWDPVESATLAVWLVLTAALHARAAGDQGRRELVVAPLLAAVAFVGVLFASFVTRSGLHPSVHAFASGRIGPALGALLVLALVLAVVPAAAAWRTLAAAPPRRPPVFWAAWLLLVAAGLIVWGLTFPMITPGLLGSTFELDTGYFTFWGYGVAIALLLLTGFGMQMLRGPRGVALRGLAIFAGLTLVAAFLTPVEGLELLSADQRETVGALQASLGRASLLSIVPPATYAVLVVGRRWWEALPGASRRARLAHTGSAAIHLGAVSVVVGSILATALTTTVTVHVDPSTQVGAASGLTVLITDVHRSEQTDRQGTVVRERETVALEVHGHRGVLASGEASLSTYPERDMGRHPEVLIQRGAVADAQVIYHGLAELGPDGLPVTVRRIPFVNLLWGGMVLLLAGMILTATAPPSTRSASGSTARERAANTESSR